MNDVCSCTHFKWWASHNAVSDETSSIELSVLGSLHYLGHGWTFDDLEEATGISEEVHHVFFHKFIEYGSVELFAWHIIMLQSTKDAVCPEYDAAGLAGCIGSMDVTHIMCKRVFKYMRQSHVGFNMSQTARTYNLIVNHACRILSTSHGHPGSWNDKTLVLFNDFVSCLHDSTILNDFSFSLLEQSADSMVVEVPYKVHGYLLTMGI